MIPFLWTAVPLGGPKGHLKVPAFRKSGPDPPDALDCVDILYEWNYKERRGSFWQLDRWSSFCLAAMKELAKKEAFSNSLTVFVC